MLSYVMSSSSLRNYPLHIVSIKGDEMLTTIPQHLDESIFFKKGNRYTLSHQSDQHLFQFFTRFIKTRTIYDQPYYVFSLLEMNELKNIRKEKRDAVSLPASFIHKKFKSTRLGCIVDISDNGFKLETLHPIDAKEIHIAYEDESSKKYKIAEVMWDNKQGDKYYYGLKLIANL
ncbi:hypothetical protein CN918_31970 [Priestia megaterium]|nr:hypothetical protein CN918_31970 [Priestia megaterium]